MAGSHPDAWFGGPQLCSEFFGYLDSTFWRSSWFDMWSRCAIYITTLGFNWRFVGNMRFDFKVNWNFFYCCMYMYVVFPLFLFDHHIRCCVHTSKSPSDLKTHGQNETLVVAFRQTAFYRCHLQVGINTSSHKFIWCCSTHCMRVHVHVICNM